MLPNVLLLAALVFAGFWHIMSASTSWTEATKASKSEKDWHFLIAAVCHKPMETEDLCRTTRAPPLHNRIPPVAGTPVNGVGFGRECRTDARLGVGMLGQRKGVLTGIA